MGRRRAPPRRPPAAPGRRCCWTAALELGDLGHAIDVALAALRDDPLDEQACRAAMTAHQRSGGGPRAPGVQGPALRTGRAARYRPVAGHPGAVPLGAARGEPVPTAPGARRRLPRPSPTPLVGRDTELADAARPLDRRASRAGPVLALVTGEAGIGKSALVDVSPRGPGGPERWCSPARASRRSARSTCSRWWRRCGAASRTRSPRQLRELAGELAGHARRADPGARRADRSGRPTNASAPNSSTGAAWRRWPSSSTGWPTSSRCCSSSRTCSTPAQSTIEALHFLATRWERGRVLVVATERTERTDEHPSGTSAARRRVRASSSGRCPGPRSPSWSHDSGLAHDVEQLYELDRGLAAVRHRAAAPPRGRARRRAGHPRTRCRRRSPGAGSPRGRGRHGAAGPGRGARDVVRARRGRRTEPGWTSRTARSGPAARPGPGCWSPHGRRASGSPTTSCAGSPTSPRPRRSGSAGTGGRPAARRPARRPRPRHLAAAGDWDGRGPGLDGSPRTPRTWLRQRRGRASCSTARRRRRGPRRRPRRCSPTLLLRRGEVRADLGHHDAARDDHEAALALARELGDEELEARALEQLGWTALYARDALGAVDLAERATAAGRVGGGGAGRAAAARAAAGPRAALGRRLRGRRRRLRPGARRRRRRRAPTRDRPGLPGRAAAAPGPFRRGPRGARAGGGAVPAHRPVPPAAAERCSSPGWPAATSATSPARCARSTAPARLIDEYGRQLLPRRDRDHDVLAVAGARRRRAGPRARRAGRRAGPPRRRGAGAGAGAARAARAGRLRPAAGPRRRRGAPRSRPPRRCSSVPCPSGRGRRCGCWRCGPGGTATCAEALLDQARTYSVAQVRGAGAARTWAAARTAARRRRRAPARTCWSPARPPTDAERRTRSGSPRALPVELRASYTRPAARPVSSR